MLPDIKNKENWKCGNDVYIVLLDLQDKRPLRFFTKRYDSPSRTLDTGAVWENSFLNLSNLPNTLIDCLCQFAFRRSATSLSCRCKILPEPVVESETPQMK